MRIAFKTFGCRANSVDSDFLYNEAIRRGFEIVSDSERADAYVVNSCTVTANADKDARIFAQRCKRDNPLSKVAVIGCYAQVAKEELVSLPEVDIVLGTAEKLKVLDYFSHQPDTKDFVGPASGFLVEEFRGSRYARANIKIQDGCNFACSFCIIPKARGRSRSLPIETIAQQVRTAYEMGFNEVILTGIHIAHYGWDLNTDLMALMRRLLSERTGPRVRLSTLDPFEIPDELISWLNSQPRLCPHFHIALQSGSDSILKSMRRIYASEEFVAVTDKIRSTNPSTFIGVDMIVGFPGETEKEFAETVNCLEKTYWTKLHVFPFSERKGTKAAELPGKVPAKVIQERSKVLREMSDNRMEQWLLSQLGQSKHVILEQSDPKDPFLWSGHTENYLPALIRTSEGEAKKILPAKVIGTRGEKVILETLH